MKTSLDRELIFFKPKIPYNFIYLLKFRTFKPTMLCLVHKDVVEAKASLYKPFFAKRLDVYIMQKSFRRYA